MLLNLLSRLLFNNVIMSLTTAPDTTGREQHSKNWLRYDMYKDLYLCPTCEVACSSFEEFTANHRGATSFMVIKKKSSMTKSLVSSKPELDVVRRRQRNVTMHAIVYPATSQ
jgi:hypothetical protein